MIDSFAGHELPDAAWRREFRRRLLGWFDRNARDLPWRRSPDLYRVWISEIMLQQTQVQTVVPYFERFIAAFPDPAALATASEEQVLRMWEGLGYYRRARQLHQAAQLIVREHGGRVPDKLEILMSLPGIGRYTAGAILSIAIDARHPVLEANTIRLLSRLLAYRDDPRSRAGQIALWQFATALLPRYESGRLNQALMELGSQVCTPREPHCPACPAALLCPTRKLGLQRQIPLPKQKKVYESLREAAVVIRHRGKVLVRRCGPDERWAGLWDFPRFAVQHDDPLELQAELIRKTVETTGLRIAALENLATIKHGVTRYRITLSCHTARCVGGCTVSDLLRWVRPESLAQIPLSSTGRQISRLLADAPA